LTIREDEVKDAILKNEQLFSDTSGSMLIYEKSVYYHKLIADVLLLTKDSGICGIEIKTEGDNLSRLPHQLDYYVRSCSYVYVFCHDSHLEKVLELLDNKQYPFVGVISYEDFEGEVIAGTIREATWSPLLSIRAAASMLWKSEVYDILRTYLSQSPSKRNADLRVHNYAGIVNKKTKYKQLLRMFSKTFSNYDGISIISNFLISGKYSDEKPLQIYYFGDDYQHGSKTFEQGYHRGK